MPRSREAQCAAKKVRYDEYLDLIAEHGVEPQYNRWWSHRQELLADTPAETRWQRLSKAEHYAFWTERFTLAELRLMAGALEQVLS